MSRFNAFRFLGQVLNPNINENAKATLHAHLRAPEFSWEELVIIASEQKVSAMMAFAIQTSEIALFFPPDLVGYFEGMEELNRQRNAEIVDQSTKIASTLNAIGVVPVFLKGAGTLLSDLYDNPAHRVMIDIDLLVPHELLFDCVAALKSTGYAEHDEDIIADPRSHHYPPLFHREGIAEIELHTEVLAFPNGELLTPEEVIASAESREKNGAKFAIPSVEHRLTHTIAHCQVTDQQYLHGFFLMRQLVECLYLAKAGGPELSWVSIEKRFAKMGKSLAYASQVVTLNDLFKTDIPAPTRSGLSARFLHKRSSVQIEFPRTATMVSKLLRPLSLFYRSMSDKILRRRFFRNIFKPAWIKRHWQRFVGN